MAEIETLEQELARLEGEQQAADSWGAALGARHERIKGLRAAVAALRPEEAAGQGEADWPSDGTCVRCGAAPRNPTNGLCNTCIDNDVATPRPPASDAPDIVERPEWLIRKNGYFYRPNRSGYTMEKVAAGRYTKAEADAEASIEPENFTVLHESAVPDAPEVVGHKETIAALRAELAATKAEIAVLAKALMKSATDREAAEAEFARLTAREKNSIRLTPAEIQSGYDRVKWAQGLIEQLSNNHGDRNSWLLNHGVGEEYDAKRKERGLCMDADTKSARTLTATKVTS